MHRCTTDNNTSPRLTRLRRTAAAAATVTGLLLGATALPVAAQTATYAGFQGQTRNFPPQALRGTLVVNSLTEASIDGNTLLLAPAFKLYNQQNMMQRPNTVVGQKLTVNYVIEKQSGRVHAAWILNAAETELKRDRADNGFWSSLFK